MNRRDFLEKLLLGIAGAIGLAKMSKPERVAGLNQGNAGGEWYSVSAITASHSTSSATWTVVSERLTTGDLDWSNHIQSGPFPPLTLAEQDFLGRVHPGGFETPYE